MIYFNQKLAVLTSIFGLIFLLSNCSENELDTLVGVDNPEVKTRSQLDEIKDEIASKVAMNLAKSFRETSVKEFVKQKSLEQFDGDFNFLIADSKDENIAVNSSSRATMSFGSILSGTDQNQANSRTSNSSDNFLESLSLYYPLLQISMPSIEGGNAESWDTESFTPLVAFIPTNIENDIIPAYDLDGNYHELSATEAPNQPVIVVKENERLIAFKKPDNQPNERPHPFRARYRGCDVLQTPYYEDNQNVYYMRRAMFAEVNSCTGGGGSAGGSVAKKCVRDMQPGKDRLRYMKFNSMHAFKKVNEWFDGGQEIEVTISFAEKNGNYSQVTKIFDRPDRYFKKCPWIFNCSPKWVYLHNTDIITWDKNKYGDKMLYVWNERDGGNIVTTNYTLNSKFGNTTQNYNVTVTSADEDDPLGQGIVEYCDDTNQNDGRGYSYGTGKITFQVSQ